MSNMTEQISYQPPVAIEKNSEVDNIWDCIEEAAQLRDGPPEIGSDLPLPFFHILQRLKTTKREGWRRFGITDDKCESISDHMYRMSLICMFPPATLAPRLNIPHCSKMALIHDMAEALVGDITPMDKIPKAEKSRRELTTMQYFTGGLLGNVEGGAVGKEMLKVWQEYEDDQTLEAHFVHDVDKIELLLQMMEYEREHEKKLDLGEFSYVASKVQLPEIRAWSNKILTEREEFWGDVEHSRMDQGNSQDPAKESYYAAAEIAKD
ncbi:HD domain-containing protein [Calycina marina]|uniref:5'-deoxynucleotidase n=1 Tax=Calycina marina TaxID=1763456 RepID=A0A9P7Z758_9HELO|nr:HD domain-containing protein [Calycina marina]